VTRPKVLLATLLLGLLSLDSHAQPNPKDLYPLRLGSKWTYRSGDMKEVVLRLKAAENVGSTPCVLLEAKREDGLVLSEYVAIPPAIQADGLYRVKLGVGNLSLPLDPPLCFLKLPSAKTNQWKIESTLGGEGGEVIRGTATLDREKVSVPFGTFDDAVRVRLELKRGDQTITITSHFAPGVGMVKQVQSLSGKEIVLELQKYEEGK
jgi:hypothetical protein